MRQSCMESGNACCVGFMVQKDWGGIQNGEVHGKCYVPYHRSNSISVSAQDTLQMHSWSSNITSHMLPFSVWTIPISAQVLRHPTICEITLTLSLALHLSMDSVQHMYTHPRSQIMVTHGADTICSVFLVTCLSHHSTCYFLLFHMSFISLPHAHCPSLPVMFHLLSISASSIHPVFLQFQISTLVHPPFSLCLRSLISLSEIKGT